MKVSEMLSLIREQIKGMEKSVSLVDAQGRGIIHIGRDCDTGESVLLTSEQSSGICADRAIGLLENLEPDSVIVTSENIYIDSIRYEKVVRPVLVCS